MSALLASRIAGSSSISNSTTRHMQLQRFARRRMVHVRSVSVLSGIARLAGRTATRGAITVGLGAGAFTWAEYKVDGFKQNVGSMLHSWNTRLGDAYDELSSAANDRIASLSDSASDAYRNASRTAAEAWADTAVAVDDRWSTLKNKFSSLFSSSSDGSEEPEGPAPPSSPNSNRHSSSGRAAAFATGAAAMPVVIDAEQDEDDGPASQSDNDLMLLTRKLIEIRSILIGIGGNDELSLPSIVVIGSQSSGKSSVLEAIVGREFLPKGDNMVTRRPIELTLVHTPPTASEPRPHTFAEFPSLGPGHITDFSIVQQTLYDLNMSVPAAECVSDMPIELRIHSPAVPDLSLVDLPGYVQVSSMDQPEELKTKIASLCDKYIRKQNIILAVCAADVDLANSPALRAAKRVDPLGMRTIGVVTKMDLIEPERAATILSNSRYPLALGYIGVVCKATPKKRSIMSRRSDEEVGSLVGPIRQQEESYFGSNAASFSREGIMVGTDTLKRRLMQVLEESMSSSLHTISNAIALELEEASYQFKVQYNDRTISAESYVAETLDVLKANINELGRRFSKQQVRQILKNSLDEQVLDLLAAYYWQDGRIADLSKQAGDYKVTPATLEPYWQRKLDAIASSLTKSGIGRTSTQLVVDAIRQSLVVLVETEPLTHHRDAAERTASTADRILRERFALTSDQVENSVKPYKYEVEVEPGEWQDGRNRAIDLIKREIGLCEGALGKIKDAVGSRKLKGATDYLAELDSQAKRRRDRLRQAKEVDENAAMTGDGSAAATPEVEDDEDQLDPTRPVFNPALISKAREAMFLQHRSDTLRLRLAALKSKRCRVGPESKAFCPEAFLNVVADKLSNTAVQFINIELLVEFFYQFPREIDTRLSYELDRAQVERFAKENPAVEAHLTLQERKEKLELVAEKLDSLVKLHRERSGDHHHHHRSSSAASRPRRSAGLFGGSSSSSSGSGSTTGAW